LIHVIILLPTLFFHQYLKEHWTILLPILYFGLRVPKFFPQCLMVVLEVGVLLYKYNAVTYGFIKAISLTLIICNKKCKNVCGFRYCFRERSRTHFRNSNIIGRG
jgi:hypothetical protein